jgi:RNA methyltransferase, TrmH family
VALSARNPRVQQVRRLVRQSKVRDETGDFVLEGSGLVAEALSTGHIPSEVFVAADEPVDTELIDRLTEAGALVSELERSTLESVASTVTPQPILATVAQPWLSIEEAITATSTFVAIGAGISDPGNAGTFIRTAAAAGADAVVFCDQSVDVSNPKAVRASAGAVFRVPVVVGPELDALWARLDECAMTSVGLAGDAARSYYEVDLTGPTALVLGNEAHGLSATVAARLSHLVSIPMERGIESVNVVAAGAAVAFELARQRRSSAT